LPDDELGGTIAQAIQEKDGAREWLTEDLYVPNDRDEPLGELEWAFRLSWDAYQVGQKIKDAIREGTLPRKRPRQLLDRAYEEGVITAEERDLVPRAEAAREQYVQVDDFDLEEYRQRRMLPGQPTDRGALDSSIIAGLERDVMATEVTRDDVGDEAPVPRGDGAPQSEEDVSRDDHSPETA
jgi:acyl-CoA dehydrogenase